MIADDVIRNISSFNCDLINRTIKLHFIWATNKHNLTQLMVKDLAYYCIFCLDHRWEEYENYARLVVGLPSICNQLTLSQFGNPCFLIG